MEKVMIYATPAEIAEGVRLFMTQNPKPTTEPSFESEKMTVGEGSRLIGVSYPTTCKWINEGKVPVHGKGRTRFVLRSELVEAYKKIK
jgi:excisionase family DNA binding protein